MFRPTFAEQERSSTTARPKLESVSVSAAQSSANSIENDLVRPDSLTPENALRFQRSVGNQAVQRMLRNKGVTTSSKTPFHLLNVQNVAQREPTSLDTGVKDKFFHKPLESVYEEKEKKANSLPGGLRQQTWDTTNTDPVKYLDDSKDRDPYELKLDKESNIFHWQGKPIDTTKMERKTTFGGSKDHEKHRVIFVMTPSGKVYVADEGTETTTGKSATTPYRFNHSSMVAGEPIASAGEMWFDDKGALKGISDKSGHYRPDKIYTVQVLLHFRESGIKVDDLDVEMFTKEGDPPTLLKAKVLLDEHDLSATLLKDTIASTQGKGEIALKDTDNPIPKEMQRIYDLSDGLDSGAMEWDDISSALNKIRETYGFAIGDIANYAYGLAEGENSDTDAFETQMQELWNTIKKKAAESATDIGDLVVRAKKDSQGSRRKAW